MLWLLSVWPLLKFTRQNVFWRPIQSQLTFTSVWIVAEMFWVLAFTPSVYIYVLHLHKLHVCAQSAHSSVITQTHNTTHQTHKIRFSGSAGLFLPIRYVYLCRSTRRTGLVCKNVAYMTIDEGSRVAHVLTHLLHKHEAHTWHTHSGIMLRK